MYNNFFAPVRPANTVRPVSSGPYNNYAGANLNRRDRYDVRAQRRWGDWGLLDFPSQIMWFDPFDAPVYEPMIAFGVAPFVPVVIDIWG